jgi:di/tripeptidase
VDLRSADEAALAGLEATLLEIVNQAAAAENARVKPTGTITVKSERVGARPAGRTDDRSAIVQTALSISKTLAMNAQLSEGSSDANLPMQLGIPAIAIGGGGRGAGAHSRQETFDTTAAVSGTARALLLAIALSRR